jgi:hypothetical protein
MIVHRRYFLRAAGGIAVKVALPRRDRPCISLSSV